MKLILQRNIIFAALALVVAGRVFAESPSLFDRLSSNGVRLTDQTTVKLETPVITQSMDATAKQKALDEIAGAAGWERFRRDSDVAPIEIDMEYIRENDQRIGHLVYVAFVAHCDLDTLRDRDQMDALFGSVIEDPKADQYDAKEISSDQLAQWNLNMESDEWKYLSVRLPLLDRILVRGVIASQHQSSEDELTVSWCLDPTFDIADSSRPTNEWLHLPSDESDSHPYQGAGGYMHVTRLNDGGEACLIEARMVIHEPPEWFSGSNLLRSKLPLMIQESVRKFRRQLNQQPKS